LVDLCSEEDFLKYPQCDKLVDLIGKISRSLSKLPPDRTHLKIYHYYAGTVTHTEIELLYYYWKKRNNYIIYPDDDLRLSIFSKYDVCDYCSFYLLHAGLSRLFGVQWHRIDIIALSIITFFGGKNIFDESPRQYFQFLPVDRGTQIIASC